MRKVFALKKEWNMHTTKKSEHVCLFVNFCERANSTERWKLSYGIYYHIDTLSGDYFSNTLLLSNGDHYSLVAKIIYVFRFNSLRF